MELITWNVQLATYNLKFGVKRMKKQFTLEYWIDDGWYVGKLLEVPGVFSQGETLEELEENAEDAYKMMIAEYPQIQHPISSTKNIAVEITRSVETL
jgi:predicted RNase H-like HicB family nuclease